MTLIGTVNIFKSSEENITAIAQRDTHIALRAAEAGVAYYRDLIDKNKQIAVYPACEAGLSWSSNSWTCSDTGTSVSWANNASIPNLDFYTNTCSSAGFSSANNFGATAVSDATIPTEGWQKVNGDPNSDLGEYRLRQYNYDDTVEPNTGTLVIEGRDRDTTGDDASAIEVSVTFPVQPATTNDDLTANLNNLDPALWIGSETIALNNPDNNNLSVDGNILITKSDCDLSSGIETIANALGNATVHPRNVPDTPIPPDDATAGPPFNLTKINVITNDSDIINVTLPRTGDNSEVVDGDNVYHYLIEDELNLTDGNEIIITSGAKVILYVQGDITITGNVDINCDDTDGDDVCDDSNQSDRLEIYGNSDESGSNQFGCASGVICPTETITFSGDTTKTINIKAFIHAPDADATVTVSNDPKVNITGAVWVQEWNDTSSNTPMVTITPDDRYLEYTTLDDPITTLGGAINPIIYAPENWQTQEVTNP
jgi:hypothetical protein